MPKKKLKKAITTKKTFKAAFIKLYRTTRLENISIQKLSELAGFSRGTFYTYYQDIYDLLEEVESELLAEWGPYFNWEDYQNNDSGRRGDPYPSMVRWYDYCQKNKDALIALMGPTGDPSFWHKVRLRLREDIRLLMQTDGAPKDAPNEFMLEYMVDGTLSILRYWLENDTKYSAEQMAYNANLLRKKWWESRNRNR